MRTIFQFLFVISLLEISIPGIGQTTGQIIQRTTSPSGWIIKTSSSSYQLTKSESGSLKPVFYGSVTQASYISKNANWTQSIEEVPVRGGYPFKTPMLEVVFKNGVRDIDLRYVSGEEITIGGRPTLKIILKDSLYPLEVTSYIRVFSEFDILEKWVVIKNTGKKGNIKVENLQSGSIVLPDDEYTLTNLSGKQENEFQLEETQLTPGVKTIQSKAFKASFNPPWFMVRPKNAPKESGPTWFGSLHYSGNWQLNFDKAFEGPLQIIGGINFWDTDLDLAPGESFETPKISFGFTDRGSERASQLLTAYVRKDILPARHRNELRPLIYNGWYATYYDVNESQQLELAKIAKEIGIETFVIDDGWFKGRQTYSAGLGDWEVDKNKFPNGLKDLIKKINDMGMQFGIWVEPESVVENSDVYRNHPDWVLHSPERQASSYRYFLNLAREDVYQYLLKALSKLLRENNIKYVKWDQNSYLSETYWPQVPKAKQRELRIRFIENLYRLVDELKKRFPDVWFESCASGGGRVDLGMLSRMDLTWPSDNVDPLDRLFIQYGYLGALPANTMLSFVADRIKHDQSVGMDYAFNVGMSGVLGVSYDVRKWNDTDKALARKKIAEYKIIRPIVQRGVLYRLLSPFNDNRCALQYVGVSDSCALLCYNMAEYLPGSQLDSRGSKNIQLKGLDPHKFYRTVMMGDQNRKDHVYKGDFLMKVGIAWPVKGAYKSTILLLTPSSKTDNSSLKRN